MPDRADGRPSPRAGSAGALRFLLLSFLAACGSVTGLDVDLDAYDPLPGVHELDFTAVRPADEHPYWEMRFSWGPNHAADSIIGAGGAFRRDELSTEVRAALDAARPPTGFAGRCLPAWCFKFIAAVDEADEVGTFNTVDDLRTFLGPVDSLAEAVMLLDAHGYTWRDAEQGVRATSDGWRAVVLELVSACDPVQTDRVLVELSASGTVTVLQREVWERLVGACI